MNSKVPHLVKCFESQVILILTEKDYVPEQRFFLPSCSCLTPIARQGRAQVVGNNRETWRAGEIQSSFSFEIPDYSSPSDGPRRHLAAPALSVLQRRRPSVGLLMSSLLVRGEEADILYTPPCQDRLQTRSADRKKRSR